AGGERQGGADHWLATAAHHPGSWWPHWRRWLRRRAGVLVPAPPRLGSDRYPMLAPAPGSYVRKRIDFNGARKEEGTASRPSPR
ncbi:MAG: hypothetical protein JRJ56_07470, partial [Deltaproteobacteria bacterium]|nr:hypothetical protein [Deltaproteobacteria bacterium]